MDIFELTTRATRSAGSSTTAPTPPTLSRATSSAVNAQKLSETLDAFFSEQDDDDEDNDIDAVCLSEGERQYRETMSALRRAQLRESLFFSLAPSLRRAASEVSLSLSLSAKTLVPLWNFVSAHDQSKHVNAHCLYLIFLNQVCERSSVTAIAAMTAQLQRTLRELADNAEYRDLIADCAESDAEDVFLSLAHTLFLGFRTQLASLTPEHPADLFLFAYLGLLLRREEEVCERVRAVAEHALSLSAPSLDHVPANDDTSCALMAIASELVMVLALFHDSLCAFILPNNNNSSSGSSEGVDVVRRHATALVAEHKSILMYCSFVLRSIHVSLAFELESFDVLSILIDEEDETDSTVRANDFDFCSHFKLMNELSREGLSAPVEDILDTKTRQRALSLHALTAWTRVDPRLGEAIKASAASSTDTEECVRLLDEGYRYVTFLTREECCEILRDKPGGSFLVRPQSENSESGSSDECFSQFLLSFRIADSDRAKPPSSASSSASSSLVKHAVIRRDCIAKSTDDGNEEAGEAGEGGEREDDEVSFQYRCGKLGPTSTLAQILRDISGIVSPGLRFEPVVPAALPFLDGETHTERESETETELDRETHEEKTTSVRSFVQARERLLSVLDANASLHRALAEYLPRLLSVVVLDPRRKHRYSLAAEGERERARRYGDESDEDDDSEDDDEDDDNSSAGGSVASEKERSTRFHALHGEDRFGIKRRMMRGSRLGWRLREREGDFRDLFVSVLRCLVYRRFLVQSVSALFTIQIFAHTERRKESEDAEGQKKGECALCGERKTEMERERERQRDPAQWRLFQALLLPALHRCALFYCAQSLLSLCLRSLCADYEDMFLAALPSLQFLSRCEERVWRTLIAPPCSHNAERECHESSGLSWFFANTYQDRESLIVESLLQRAMRSLRPKAVRKDKEKESHAVWAMDSVEAEELLQSLSRSLSHLDDFLATHTLLSSSSHSQCSSPRLSEDLHDMHPYREANDPFREVQGEREKENERNSLSAEEKDNNDKDKTNDEENMTLSVRIRSNLRSQRLFFRESNGDGNGKSSGGVGDAWKKLATPLDTLFHAAMTSSSVHDTSSVAAAGAAANVFRNYETVPGTAQHDRRTMQLLGVTKDLLTHSRFPFYPYTTADSQKSAQTQTQSSSLAVSQHHEDQHRSGSNNLSVDMAQRMITLFFRHHALRQFSKAAEIAFLASTVFYKYVDPWEVRAVTDEGPVSVNSSRDTLSLGRHTYRPVRDYRNWKSSYPSIAGNLFLGERRDDKDQLALELQPFLTLWGKVKAEDFIINLIAQSSLDTSGSLRSCMSPYIDALHTNLYKNALFKRLHMPLRFCAVVQVDVYGLKQVTAMRRGARRDTDNDKEGDRDRVVPSSIAHQSALEVFSLVRLDKAHPHTQEATDAIYFSAESPQLARSSAGPRAVTESMHCSSTKRVEPHVNTSSRRSEDPSQNAVTSPLTASQATTSAYNSKNLLTQITQSLDYDFRATSSFRFALPGGWLETFASECPEIAAARAQEELYTHIRAPPPLQVSVSVFEKSFFGDVKLGEAEIDMNNLNDSNVVRDWYPLRPDKSPSSNNHSFSWLVYAQTKLRFQLLQVEDLPDEFPYAPSVSLETLSAAPNAQPPASSAMGATVTASLSHMKSVQSVGSLSSWDDCGRSTQTATSVSAASATAGVATTVTAAEEVSKRVIVNEQPATNKAKSSTPPATSSSAAANFFHSTFSKVRSTTTNLTTPKQAPPLPPQPTTQAKSSKGFLAQLDDLF